MSILTLVELEVEADGDYYAGTGQVFDKNLGQYLPGDNARIKNLKVTLNKSNRSIDITDALPQDIKDQIIDQLLEEQLRHGDEEAV